MYPTRRFPDRSRMAPSQIELVIPVIGVGLQDAGIARQMRLGMLAPAVARVVEHRRRWIGATKRPVVPDVDPAPSRVGLSLGQDWHRCIIGMKALGRHDIGFEAAQQGIKRRTDRSHGVCHGRQRNRHTFESVALRLTVRRLMLLEHDHGQKARAGPPCDGMERRWSLADLLAVTTGELLPHRLDHLPLAWHRFQRPGHVLAEFAQAMAAAALATRRRIDHHPLAREMFGEGLALGALALKSAHSRRLGDGPLRRKFVFSCVSFQLFERQARQTRVAFVRRSVLANNSSWSVHRSAGRLPRACRGRVSGCPADGALLQPARP